MSRPILAKAPGRRLSMQNIAVAGLYLVVVAVIFLYTWPAHVRKQEVLQDIAFNLKFEQQLLQALEKRPRLEQEQATLKAEIKEYGWQIPGQADLSAVVGVIEGLMTQSQLDLIDVDYSPLLQEGLRAWIAINLAAEGDACVLSFIKELSRAFPSLQVQELKIESTAEGRLSLVLNADLDLIGAVEPGDVNPWQGPVVNNESTIPKRRLGPPFALIEELYCGRYQLLGIVTSGPRKYALISIDGIERWMQIGDHLANGQIVRIERAGVTLDLAGVWVRLKMRS